ncbi:MAG: SRPBCC family protein [Ramlibacter sp.]|nr:SRPBCC family protein [Ramlibacter sp.]
MKVLNVHQRLLYAQPGQVGALIDALASPSDLLWRGNAWPRMAFDRPLGVGATGGHGPIRYTVIDYTPGQSIRFGFTAPRGFDGWHGLDILDATAAHCVLEHRVDITLHGAARLSWPLVYRPLHDALIEDGLAAAQAALGNTPRVVPWSPWVRLLRRLMTRRPRPQLRWPKEPANAR